MDIVELLNQAFPDPSALEERLEEAQDYLGLCQDYLRLRLSEQPSSGEVRRAATEAPAQLAKLQQQTDEIQKIGGNALARVDEVTAGIKRLDRTKENLTQTVRMLRQLRMLSKLHTQLTALARRRAYAELATTVTAAADLINFFRPYRSVPRIAEISQRTGEVETTVYEQIQSDFNDALSGRPEVPLRDACLVVDALNKQAALIEWYAHTVLREYFQIFNVADEAGSLENAPRRYAYLKNKVFGPFTVEHQTWFPSEWKVRDEVLNIALNSTAQDLQLHCENLQSTSEQDMQLLVTVLQEARDFERQTRSPPIISEALAPYMSRWVDFEDRQLAAQLLAWRMGTEEAEDGVFVSSRELVSLLKVLLGQVTKLAPSQLPILSKVMAKWLGRYGNPLLTRRLLDRTQASTVATTAKYLLTTVTQLEEQQDNAGDDYTVLAREPLLGVLDRAVQSLAAQIASRADPVWREMAQPSSWNQGTVSNYAVHLGSLLEQAVGDILGAVNSPSVVVDTCFRVVDTICSAFVTTGMARTPRPVTEPAAEQMLLDLYSIKTRLTQLVEYAPLDSQHKQSPRLRRFPERVRQIVANAEAIFKVLLTPTEPLNEFVENYVTLLKDRSVVNFQKILEVKAGRYQARAVELFRKRVAAEKHEKLGDCAMLTQVTLNPPRSGDTTTSFPSFRQIGQFLRRD